ncbi:MAG: ADP-ribosylglycohydrolase family protein, partial [Anaerolineae bacterium]|nr:ADP-ribosylglycohydrolase family protein [Anaerolineae bacterium]
MTLPQDYAERVYAGVLGKIIGVYLGRPFEGWWYDRIMRDLGEIWYYVHDRRGVPLIVTDDDISGTFTFVRALADYGYARDLTPA